MTLLTHGFSVLGNGARVSAPACTPRTPPHPARPQSVGQEGHGAQGLETRASWRSGPPVSEASPSATPSWASRRGRTAKALAPDSWALLPGVRRELGTEVRWGPRGRKGLHRSVDLGRPGRRKPGTAPQSLSSFNTATASSLWVVATPSTSSQPSSFLPPPQTPRWQGSASCLHATPSPALCSLPDRNGCYPIFGPESHSYPEPRPFPQHLGPPSLLTGAVGVWADGSLESLLGEGTL